MNVNIISFSARNTGSGYSGMRSLKYARQRIYVLCNQKELLEVLELNVREDHIHIVMWIPPKYSISSVMGYLKGKLALRLFQKYENLGKRYWGRRLLARGCCVSAIGLDEAQIRSYVRWQEKHEKDIEHQQMSLLSNENHGTFQGQYVSSHRLLRW